MKIKITRIDKELPLPEYKTAGAVAFDLYSREEQVIPPKERALLLSNFIIQVPEGHAIIMANRSSTGPKKGLTMPNGIGIIDQDFHGPQDEIRIAVYNFTENPVKVERGERIAQALIVPIEKVEFEEVDQIKNESRGGFGTTG